jgi:hypothetical protein
MTKKNKALAARLKEIAEERLALFWNEERFQEDFADAMKPGGFQMAERDAVEHAAELQVNRHESRVCESIREDVRATRRAMSKAASDLATGR